MRVGWLCPFVDDPKLCVGAVVEALNVQTKKTEYIPVILPLTPLDECMRRGGAWVLSRFADELLVFHDRISAEGFLFDTFEAHQWDLLSVVMIEHLLDKWGGFARHASEYGIIIPGIPYDLN